MGKWLCAELPGILDARPSQELLAPVFKRLPGRYARSMKSTAIKATVSRPSFLETRDRLVCEEAGWGSGRGGAHTGSSKGNGDSRLGNSCRGCCLDCGPGAPALAAMGNPSDGEMGRLLTREIKSGRDEEYLYAHLLTRREDASSRVGCKITLFPTPEQREPFVWAAGRTMRPPLGHSPQGCSAAAQPTGRGPGNLPSAATAATGQPPVTSWAEGRGTKSHLLKPGTNLLGKAPAPSCGQTRAVGPMAVGRGPGRTGAAATTED